MVGNRLGTRPMCSKPGHSKKVFLDVVIVTNLVYKQIQIIGKTNIWNKYENITFLFKIFNHFLEAPGTFPHLPGWILGHPSEVEQKLKCCQKEATVGVPAH